MSEQKLLSVYEVVNKLIGPIRPVGETNADEVRFENLKTMSDLVNRLLYDIDQLIKLKDRPEHSIARAGKYANQIFDSLGIKE